MEEQRLSFRVMLSYLNRVLENVPDSRQSSNARRYGLQDLMLSVFVMFYMKCSSFLEHQCQMQSRQSYNNAQRLFGLRAIPTATQIRNVLNGMSAAALFPVFVTAARARWKGENENHNVLKTNGYHLEHNFGHGQRHLVMTLLTLNLLAFLLHKVLCLTDTAYQAIRKQRGICKGFFQDIQSLTKYLLSNSWQHLLGFVLDDSGTIAASNTS